MRLPFMRSAPLALALSVSFSLGCNYYGDCDHPWDEEPFPPDPCAGGGCVPPRDVDAGYTDASHGDGAASHRCTRDTECGEAERCEPSGVCTPRPPGWCADAADCRADEACVAHHCESLDSVCHVDLDCGAGRGCIDNACRPLCVSDTECGAGMCIGGHCNPTLQCDVTHTCADGATCVDGTCAAACVDSTSCARGEVCTGGLCIPDVAPRPFCASDADCAAGHPCLDGVCRTLCPSGTLDECQRSDAQFVSCMNTGAHLLCLMRSEASPECVTPSDCLAGQRCIDAQCR